METHFFLQILGIYKLQVTTPLFAGNLTYNMFMSFGVSLKGAIKKHFIQRRDFCSLVLRQLPGGDAGDGSRCPFGSRLQRCFCEAGG